jgi:hypothetical protein
MASWRGGREVRSTERSPNPFAVSTAVRIRSLPTPCLLTLTEVTTSSIRARWPEMVLCRVKVRVPTTSPSLLATNSVMFGLVSTRSRSSCRSGWADDESSWRSAFSPFKSSSVAEPASSLSTTVPIPSSLMPALRTLPEVCRREADSTRCESVPVETFRVRCQGLLGRPGMCNELASESTRPSALPASRGIRMGHL